MPERQRAAEDGTATSGNSAAGAVATVIATKRDTTKTTAADYEYFFT